MQSVQFRPWKNWTARFRDEFEPLLAVSLSKALFFLCQAQGIVSR